MRDFNVIRLFIFGLILLFSIREHLEWKKFNRVRIDAKNIEKRSDGWVCFEDYKSATIPRKVRLRTGAWKGLGLRFGLGIIYIFGARHHFNDYKTLGALGMFLSFWPAAVFFVWAAFFYRKIHMHKVLLEFGDCTAGVVAAESKESILLYKRVEYAFVDKNIEVYRGREYVVNETVVTYDKFFSVLYLSENPNFSIRLPSDLAMIE